MNFENGPISVDETTPIWRYVGLPALLLYLDGKLRLQSIDSLKRQDPMEGVPVWDEVTQSEAFNSEESNQLWNHVYSQLSPADKQLWEANKVLGNTWNQTKVYEAWNSTLNTTRYALCFIESPHESIAMWRLFAPRGFAIRTSVRHLRSALASGPRDWRIGMMRYWDRMRPITPDDTYADITLRQLLKRPYFLKAREYEHEREVRLLTFDPGPSSTVRFRMYLMFNEIRRRG